MIENVSLSKILDAFIIENEDAFIIVQFLQDHEDYISEIFRYSFYWKTIYQINFVYNLKDNPNKLNFLFKHCSAEQIRYLYWQTLQYKKYHEYCDFSFLIKILSKYFDSIPVSKHPYSSRLSNITQSIDKTICENLDNIVNVLHKLSITDFASYIQHINLSLYHGLVCNINVYLNLNAKYRYILLKSIEYNVLFDNFYIQLLNSSVVSAAEKQLICDQYFDSIRYNIVASKTVLEKFNKLQLNSEIFDAIKRNDFSSLLLHIIIDGQNILPILFYLCVFKKFNILKEWYKYSPDDITNNLDISNMLASQ